MYQCFNFYYKCENINLIFYLNWIYIDYLSSFLNKNFNLKNITNEMTGWHANYIFLIHIKIVTGLLMYKSTTI